MTVSDIDNTLVQTYRSTDYIVESDPPFSLHIGVRSEALACLYDESVRTAAFLTACNPFSKPVSESENSRNNAQLAQAIRQGGYRYINGVGKDPSGTWDGEESFLVLGIDRGRAIELGKQFQQNAIVWCDQNAVADLILLQ